MVALGRSTKCALLAALGVLAPGCFDVKSVEPGIEVVPDANGRVVNGELGIQGYWYSYGDQYDRPKACTNIGLHEPKDCSTIYWPPPLPTLGFPNDGGSMCTYGDVAQVKGCVKDTPLTCRTDTSGLDYSFMWGAGIGLDFGLRTSTDDPRRDPLITPSDEPSGRQAWDPTAHGIVGVAFDFLLVTGEVNGAPHLRVEFPIELPMGSELPDGRGTASLGNPPVLVQDESDGLPNLLLPDDPPSSEEHPFGSPFWGAPPAWRNDTIDVSPVRRGHNVVRFDQVKRPADANYEFDRRKLLGIQFHVSTMMAARLDYGFCISNLTFLRD